MIIDSLSKIDTTESSRGLSATQLPACIATSTTTLNTTISKRIYGIGIFLIPTASGTMAVKIIRPYPDHGPHPADFAEPRILVKLKIPCCARAKIFLDEFVFAGWG